jgi:two-component system nitrogen regulation sensor histidine kinase NtrY
MNGTKFVLSSSTFNQTLMSKRFTSLLKLIFVNKNIFLTLAITAFGLALLLLIITKKGPVSAIEDKYLYDIQTKIHDEIKASNEDLAKVVTLVSQSKDTTFSHLKTVTIHPYYIFRNGQLVFWSDSHFVPDYQLVEGNYNLKSVSTTQGKFVVNRRLIIGTPDNFEVFSMVSLYRQYESESNHLKTSYNPLIFTSDPKQIDSSPVAATHLNMYAETKEFLFSVTPLKADNLKNQTIPENVIILGLLSMFFLVVYLLAWIWFLNKEHRFGTAFLLLMGYFMLFRAIMLFYNIPFIFYESDLFNSKFYNSTFITPSLGDSIINLVVIIIMLIYLVNYYYKMKRYFWLLKLSDNIKKVISVIVVIISFIIFQRFYRQLINIYEKSTYQLDISMSIDFLDKTLKLSTLIAFVLTSIVYFLSIHLLTNLLIKLNRKESRWAAYALLIGFLIWGIFAIILLNDNLFLLLLHGLYIAILLFTKLPKYFYTFRYQTSIYFFIGALVCAGLGTYVVHNQAIRKDFIQKQQFGKKYLAENDEIGEFKLSKANVDISKDSTIKVLIKSALLPREQVQGYIRKTLLDIYFDYYDTEVSAFDVNGKSLDNVSDAQSFQAYEDRYKTTKYQTDYSNIFFINDASNSYQKQYIDFIPLLNNENKAVGYVIIDLKKRSDAIRDAALADSPTSGEEQLEAGDYSYAVYESGKIIKTGGKSYNYERKMPISLVEGKQISDEGIIDNGFNHVATTNKNGRKIVVSSEKISLPTIYSNFSFLFLTLVITIIFVVLSYAIRYGFSNLNVNFATKIQIYLNVAFLLPLILVVGITLQIIGTKLSESQMQSYISQTENTGISILPAIDRYVQGKMSKQYLTDTLKSISTNAKKYVSVFDVTGRLLATNKELSYETGIVSTYLNPEAYVRIVEEQEHNAIIPETMGNLDFMGSYVGINSNDGKLSGVVNIPFYDSKVSNEQEISEVIGSLLNTFTTIFLGLLLLSYFASNVLTVPLRLITNKLRKIDLSKPNEPLAWRSDDEIGVLIKAYNDMLVKLDESKVALADTTKQSAWQQMAKQVVHEIKNPLTPMKLSLQLLQHKLSKGATIDTAQIKDQIESLTGQIDNLSYIANSFSDFARLPVPKREVFDFIYEVNKVVNLYSENRKINLSKDVPQQPVMVWGDRQLTGNIINNLLMNAIQSVPTERKPNIKIKVEINTEAVTFSITDNGTGVLKENASKIFMLDFSTKAEGTGVGLALAKWVVDNSKGSIWFDTAQDVGSTFYFTLPLAG